jgi:hypothetical protein
MGPEAKGNILAAHHGGKTRHARSFLSKLSKISGKRTVDFLKLNGFQDRQVIDLKLDSLI